MESPFAAYRKAASFLKSLILADETPLVGIICGSGLSGLSSTLTETTTVKYSDIPGFPAHCTVAGHKGEVVIGKLSGIPTMAFRGRFHSYEGHDMNTVVLPVRVMRCLGVKVLLVTNAAGGLNPTYNVGDVITVTDYVALPMLAGKNPLVGPNDSELGPRFPSTSDAFDEELCKLVKEGADNLSFQDFVGKRGTYCFVSGPMYESKGECRFLRTLGGDAVGMSTVPEIVAAHHCGIKVICLSLITNKVIVGGDEGPAATHGEVLEAVEKRSVQMQSLIKEIVVLLQKKALPSIPDLPPIDLSGYSGKNESRLVDAKALAYEAVLILAGVVLGSQLPRK